jgi:hypothetical protein
MQIIRHAPIKGWVRFNGWISEKYKCLTDERTLELLHHHHHIQSFTSTCHVCSATLNHNTSINIYSPYSSFAQHYQWLTPYSSSVRQLCSRFTKCANTKGRSVRLKSRSIHYENQSKSTMLLATNSCRLTTKRNFHHIIQRTRDLWLERGRGVERRVCEGWILCQCATMMVYLFSVIVRSQACR